MRPANGVRSRRHCALTATPKTDGFMPEFEGLEIRLLTASQAAGQVGGVSTASHGTQVDVRFTDPLLERLADDRRTDVDYPLFRSLRYVLIVRKEVSDIGNVGDELQDLLDGERLILRYMEVLNLII